MKKTAVVLMTVLCSTVAEAQPKKGIGYEDTKSLQAASVYGLRTMKDGKHYTVSRDRVVLRYRYSDGELVDTLFESPYPDFGMQEYALSKDESKILITTQREQIYRHSRRAEHWIYFRDRGFMRRISYNGKQQEATLSPDGKKVAFVRDNNLFIVDLETFEERQITTDGEPGRIINGIPDWVYEEEYSFSRAYEWSPASDAIAFYRFDESHVKKFTMVMDPSTENYPKLNTFKYPRAGERNSVVEIKVYHLEDGRTLGIDLGKDPDSYIPRIGWHESEVVIHWLNRLQNDYQVFLADSREGSVRMIYREQDPRYLERIGKGTLVLLPDDKGFVVKSEQDGWMHLYLYGMDGKLKNRITEGEWEVTTLYGIDAKKGKLYYGSTERSPLCRDIYEIGLNGKGKRRLSGEEPGDNGANFSRDFTYMINFFSNVSTPERVTLHKTTSKKPEKPIRVLEDNTNLKERIAKAGYVIPEKEFFTFATPEGVELNGWMMKPADFDPAKQYPVLMTQYSGPGSQRAGNRWSVSWEMALLQEGIIVVCVDGRGTGFRGAEFRKCTYGSLGRLEVADQIATARYLGGLSYVDAGRIGIYGWSYGGFMALNCILKGADVFSVAVAVAPVTSWRFYDTIYTELYNGLPQDNPAGYDDNSPIHYAGLLKGKLLIAHGTGDDNVHIQNTEKMVQALVKEKKDFRMLIYPDENHSMGSSRDHLMLQIIEFLKENL